MSIIKNVNVPYVIRTINDGDPIILDASRVLIRGNLTVSGNSSTVTSTDTAITDQVIMLNVGETGAGVTLIYSGLEIDRGTAPNVSLLWNENIDQWQITKDGSIYANLSSYTTGVNMERVSDDPTPVLGGNLFVGSNAIVSTGSVYINPETELRLDGNLTMKIYPDGPAATPNYNILHAGNVAQGGSGLYVTSGEQNIVNQELITKRRAIVYSIIF
jgi:hypothetical protein